MARLLAQLNHTIVALATPAGRAGVSIIRLSGASSLDMAQKIAPNFKREAQKIMLVDCYDSDSHLIDKALLVYFKGPNSLTGEDVVEFQCHGSPVIVEAIIQACLKQGARLAGPGEFLQRAFVNQKYDLTEVEAVAALINAKTRQAARASLQVASGRLGFFVKSSHDKLMEIRVLLESTLDFSEEEVGDFLLEKALHLLEDLICSVRNVVQTSSGVIKLHTGLDVCFIGPPNAGKSSLLNHLAQDDIAIVHEIAGTTRDTLKAEITVAGIPITLIDTAGLRKTTCAVEQAGIEKGRKQAGYSSVVIYLIPYGEEIDPDHLVFLRSLNVIKILLVNKIDLFNIQPYSRNHLDFDVEVGVSVLKRSGIDQLIAFFEKTFIGEWSEETPFVANIRQLNVIKDFLDLLEESRDTILRAEIAADLLAEANKVIGTLTGEHTTEELLGQIFSTFCIGK